eukprot:TRINITY_DN3183_c0_g1_i1.p1 TRINITY_DN3183_c0_g1~~TRINITY_DN3183_c0_g1_i1.p1  ORF type:complete len:161 (-),score=14.59 TRINITY_DN3183_c0_g1_i1:232-714(-)
MLKENSEAPWGNHVSPVRISVPLGKMNSPLEAVKITKRLLDRKKNSFEDLVAYFFVNPPGAKEASEASKLVRTLGSSTMFISNIVGPRDKICMWGIPVEGFSFFARGLPQAVQAYIVSYVDTVVIRVIGCKSYVDAHVLSKILQETTMQAKTAVRNMCSF